MQILLTAGACLLSVVDLEKQSESTIKFNEDITILEFKSLRVLLALTEKSSNYWTILDIGGQWLDREVLVLSI